MTSRSYRTSTAIVASLTLLIPPTAPVMAQAEEVEVPLLCLDGTEPPCPEGEPIDGTPADQIPDMEVSSDDAAPEAEGTDITEDEAEVGAEDEQQVEPEVEVQAETPDAADETEAPAESEADIDQAPTPEPDAAPLQADAETADDEVIEDQAATEPEATETDTQTPEAESPETIAEEEAPEEDMAPDAVPEEGPAAESTDTSDAEVVTEEADDDTPVTPEDDQATASDEAPAVDPTMDEEPSSAAAADDDGAEEAAEVEEEVLDDSNTRSAEEEFDTTVAAGTDTSDTSDRGMSNFERALLVGIGAVAVGSLLNNGRDQVVANTGDRVVVEGDSGLTIYRDDDALLRQPGATLRTETFDDGSARTILTREDGSRVVTVRDARGRVLQRTSFLADGTEVDLFDDRGETQPVDIMKLRETAPASQTQTVSQADEAALAAFLSSDLSYDPNRRFSLRQIREISEVRNLAPALDLDTINFATGSAAIQTSQVQSLLSVGIAMEEMLERNPGEVFLIEGHTDAIGSDALNLALSDRRAETVALALSQYFSIPPENLVVQGYGEQFLKIPTQLAEPVNRRATIRRITPLLRVAAN